MLLERIKVISLPAVAPSNFTLLENVETPATLTLSKFVWPSTSKSPFASIAHWNVAVPELTVRPLRAVIMPTESILVTSSYVNVPPIETLPENVPSTAVTLPEAVRAPSK